MKKPQMKTDDKSKYFSNEDYRKANEAALAKPHNNSAYTASYNSLQNLRPANMVFKDADSPNKVDPSVKNSRRPDFFKNFAKIGHQQQGLQRRSFKQLSGFTRETANEIKNKESPNKVKLAKNKELRETVKSDASQYQKLNDKLNYIQNKIQELSSNIDKKR